MAAVANQPHQATLMGLSPELRNEIYRLILVEPGKIEVGAVLDIPGILQTCRQIRAEASSIWYEENSFRFTISNFDASLYLLWCSRTTVVNRKKAELEVEDADDWENLLDFTKAAYDGQCGYIKGPSCGDGPAHVAFCVQKMAALRQKDGDSWRQVARYLDLMQGSLSNAFDGHRWTSSREVDWESSETEDETSGSEDEFNGSEEEDESDRE